MTELSRRETELESHVRDKTERNFNNIGPASDPDDAYRLEWLNIERRYRQGGYRRRQLAELLQNAIDAARAETPETITVRGSRRRLYVANTGEPLTKDGLTALLHSHSSKKSHQIGKYGVGFKSLLAVSATIEIFSRSISIAFDAAWAKQRAYAKHPKLMEVSAEIPILRFGRVIDPRDETDKDPTLDRLFREHDTVVRVELRDDRARDVIQKQLAKKLRYELLLFTGKTITLDCEGKMISVVPTSPNHRELRIDDETRLWRVFERRVSISPTDLDAHDDAGDLYDTEDLPVAWAIHSSSNREPPKVFWSFFPLTELNRVPGILNAPFKTNDDRSNLAEGPFNSALLKLCAELVVDKLAELRTDEDRALHLDYLPRRDAGSALAEEFGDHVWSLARDAKLAPICTGGLRSQHRMRTPPTASIDLMNAWLELSPPESSQWAHADVVRTRDRTGRWFTLLNSSRRDERSRAREWIEAVASSEITTASRVVDLAVRLMKEVDKPSTKEWRIIPDEDGVLQCPSKLYLDGDVDTVHPRLLELPGMRESLKDLGVQPRGAKWFREEQESAYSEEDWELFWQLRRASPPAGRYKGPFFWPPLHIHTRSGVWRIGLLCIRGNQIRKELGVAIDSCETAALLLPSDEHNKAELALAGVSTKDDPWIGIDDIRWARDRPEIENPIFSAWKRKEVESSVDSVGGNPPHVICDEQPRLPINAILLESPVYQALVTSWWTKRSRSLPPWRWGYGPNTKTGSKEFPNPVALALKRHGDWSSTNSPIAPIRYALARLVRNEGKLCQLLAVDKLRVEKVVRALQASDADWSVPKASDIEEARDSLRSFLASEPREQHIYEAAERIEALPADKEMPSRPPHRAAGDVFPWLEGHLREDPTPEIRLEREECEVAFHVDPDDCTLVLSGIEWSAAAGLPREEVITGAVSLNWLNKPRREVEEALRSVEECRAHVREAKDASTAEKLLMIFGPSALRSRLADAASQLQGVDDLGIAEVFLWRFGAYALRELTKVLHERGFAPPARWGTPAARMFVSELGMPEDFMGVRSSDRQPVLTVHAPETYKSLHDFQERVYRDLEKTIVDHATAKENRAMVCLPTGAGKTRVVVETIVDLVLRVNTEEDDARRKRLVLWIAQRDELCEQAVQTFQWLWRTVKPGTDAPRAQPALAISRYWGGNPVREASGPQVVVATIDTIRGACENNEPGWLAKPSILVIDEAHHAEAKSYRKLIDWVCPRGHRTVPIVGISATPRRGSAKEEESYRLARRFGLQLIPPMKEQEQLHDELLGKEILAEAEYEPLELPGVSPPTFDSEDLEKFLQYRDFPSRIRKLIGEQPERNERIVERMLNLGVSRSLLFAASVSSARWLAAALTARGCPAAAIDGDTPPASRRFFLRAFADGELKCLVNYGVLTTGFDEPGIEAVVISRPTCSPVLYHQMVGRGLRGPENGGTKHCKIITVKDNWESYRDTQAWRVFQDFWNQVDTR